MMKPYVFGLVPSLRHFGRLALAWVFVLCPLFSASSPRPHPLQAAPSNGVANNYRWLESWRRVRFSCQISFFWECIDTIVYVLSRWDVQLFQN